MDRSKSSPNQELHNDPWVQIKSLPPTVLLPTRLNLNLRTERLGRERQWLIFLRIEREEKIQKVNHSLSLLSLSFKAILKTVVSVV